MLKLVMGCTELLVLSALLTYSATALNLQHENQLILTANAVNTTRTHIISLAGDPNIWIISENQVLDIHRDGFRWEELAYNYHQKYVVFSESRSRTANLLMVPSQPNVTELVHYPVAQTGPPGGEKISSIDVDWLSNNVYIADTSGIIYAIRVVLPTSLDLQPKLMTTVIYNGTQLIPRALKVHPKKGYLFVILESKGYSTIQRFDLAGSTNRMLVSSGLDHPTALTIDYDSDTLYWVENHDDISCSIHSCDTSGSNIRSVTNRIANCQSNGIDFSVHYLVVANSVGHSVVIQPTAFAAFPTRTTIPGLQPQPYSLIMYDEFRQSVSNGVCTLSNGGCSDFCFHIGSKQIQCGCQHGYHLGENGKTCKLDLSIIPTQNFAIVYDQSPDLSYDSHHLYLVDLSVHISIPLPVQLEGEPSQVLVQDRIIYWSSRGSIYTFDLNIGLSGEAFKDPQVDVAGFSVLNEILFVNTRNESGDQTRLIDMKKDETKVIIEHQTGRHPSPLAVWHSQRLLLIGVQFDDETNQDIQERVLKYSLAGKLQGAAVKSAYPIKSMVLDQSTDKLYSCHTSARGDLILVTDLTLTEEADTTRLLAVNPAESEVIGQLGSAGPYLYYYSSKENRILWRRSKSDDALPSAVVSGRVFNSLQGALWVQDSTDTTDGRWNPCVSQPCSHLCIPDGQSYTCACPDDNLSCDKQETDSTSGYNGSRTSAPFSSTNSPNQEISEPANHQSDSSHVIIGVTVGICITVLLVVLIICLFCVWKTRKHAELMRSVSQSTHTLLSRNTSLDSSIHPHLSYRTSSTVFSIVNEPLPTIPDDDCYSTIDEVTDTYLHPPGSSSASCASSHVSSVRSVTNSEHKTLSSTTARQAALRTSRQLPRQRPDRLSLALPQRPSISAGVTLRCNSLYHNVGCRSDSTLTSDHVTSSEYLYPSDNDDRGEHRQYLEVLPVTPKSSPKVTHEDTMSEVSERTEDVYDDVNPAVQVTES